MLQNYKISNNLAIAVNNKKKELKQLESYLISVLTKSPVGKLRISSCRGNTTYYLDNRNKTGENRGKVKSTYLPKNNMDLVQQLAQKGYTENLLKEVKRQIDILDRIPLSGVDQLLLDNVYSDLSDARKKLVLPYRSSDEEYVEQWKAKTVPRSEVYPENLRFTTNNNELVRSKSEMVIADRLLAFNIPYRYEAQLKLKDGTTIHPDFTILNKKNRRNIYWEHFGLMDKKSYANDMAERVEMYLKNGILLGESLIVTFETAEHPLDKLIIDETIKQYLLD